MDIVISTGLILVLALPSLIFCRLVMNYAPKDSPDTDRKNQPAPVPTSGGIGIFLGTIPAALIIMVLVSYEDGRSLGSYATAFPEQLTQHIYWPYILLGAFALLIGSIDDRNPLPAKFKLGTLGAACLLAVLVQGGVEKMFLPVADATFILAPMIAIAGSALWLFVIMNVTNFMDGSNGLAMGCLTIMLTGLLFYLNSHATGFYYLGVTPLIIACSILGFLFWNLQGKLYAGDAGSLFGGTVFASLGVYAARDGNIWFPATLALPFLVDVFMTLIWRARQRHNLLTPHRHHAYQLFIRSGWGHIKTALLWWSLAGICALSALWAVGDSQTTSAWMFFALLGVGCLLWFVQRRIYLPRAIA